MLVRRIESLEAELAELQADYDALETRLHDRETALSVAVAETQAAKGQLAICQREQKYALIA